jgi:hypothetical protein
MLYQGFKQLEHKDGRLPPPKATIHSSKYSYHVMFNLLGTQRNLSFFIFHLPEPGLRYLFILLHTLNEETFLNVLQCCHYSKGTGKNICRNFSGACITAEVN